MPESLRLTQLGSRLSSIAERLSASSTSSYSDSGEGTLGGILLVLTIDAVGWASVSTPTIGDDSGVDFAVV